MLVHAACGGHIFWVEYDYGACRETGYHDTGEWPHCEKCGLVDEGDCKEEKNDETAN